MSESRKGRFTGVNNPSYGKAVSEETKKKLSIACRGRKHTPDEIRKQILAQKGRIFSEETRRKISIALTGKKLSLETRRKISQVGKHLKEETKKKLSLVFKGRKFSEEWREKIRQARLRQVLPLRDTEIEKMLQIRLLEKGIKFETHKAIVGQPDIFIKPNICIFCDGDYWHANPKFYGSNVRIVAKNKTASQIWQRDADVTKFLEVRGYEIFRFWEDEIRSNADDCIDDVLSVIQNG